MVGIYKIINLANGKVYIGKSLRLEYRYKKHLWNLNKNNHINKHLQAAYNKYSNINFWFEIIEECSKSDICEREIYWIEKYKSYDPEFGYNKTKGGDGLKATNEIKLKISNSLKGKKHTLERRLNQSKAQSNLKRTHIHKKNISKSLFKKVVQYDIFDNFIKEWESINQIEKELNYNATCISRCCNNKQKISYGFKWKFKTKQ